jgi:hypothetical protein
MIEQTNTGYILFYTIDIKKPEPVEAGLLKLK